MQDNQLLYILINLIPIFVIFFIFYLLLVVPQRKKMKEHEKMLANLKKGDYVITNSGLVCQIINIKGSYLEVKLSENTKATILKTSVERVLEEIPK
ncbi:MAG: preprotein translocase subunit YajC [bacterium]|nr:preprotein translocase subunit YajC [bacterium]